MRWTGLRLQSGIIAFRVSHYSEPEVTTKIQLARLASYSEHGGMPTTVIQHRSFFWSECLSLALYGLER